MKMINDKNNNNINNYKVVRWPFEDHGQPADIDVTFTAKRPSGCHRAMCSL